MLPVTTLCNPLCLLPPPVFPKKLALVHRTGSTYGALDALFVVDEGAPIFAGAAEFNGLLTLGALGGFGCFGSFGIFIFGMEQHEQPLQQSQGAQHAQQGAQHDEQHGEQHMEEQHVGAQHMGE